MSHHLYTTPGFIMRTSERGEANKYIYVFTRDLGRIGAVAQGVRLQKSKLRYHLQELSFGTVSLIRGKDTWRIVNIESSENFFYALRNNPERKAALTRLFKIVDRLVRGEEKNETLFRILEQTLAILTSEELSPELLKGVEYLAVFSILDTLGYGDTSEAFNPLRRSEIDREGAALAYQLRKSLVPSINISLRQSQL